MKKEIKRKFTGKLGTEFKLNTSQALNKEDEISIIQEFKSLRHFYDRMLRAYLQGKEFFNFGFETQDFKRVPIRHKVEYSLT